MKQPVFDESVSYYSENYEEISRYPFLSEKKTRIQDHVDLAERRCRFCGKGVPDVAFSKTAHAVPEFLGNRDILSMNECDVCNDYLATQYEDHLSKWSQYPRALSQIKGKKKKPTFKNPGETLRVESDQSGLQIAVSDPSFTSKPLQGPGPHTLPLPSDAESQAYIPLRAALTLVKIACSVCPPEELEQIAPAISWLRKPDNFTISCFTVMYAFTPGPISSEASEVVLLRRKVDKPIPYLWCVVQFANHRLQTFVPLCPADADWIKPGANVSLKFTHFPTRFGTEWPFGETTLGWFDWSGVAPVQSSATASLHVLCAKQRETRPGD